MLTILYVWTVFTATADYKLGREYYANWYYAGEYASISSCEYGAKRLGLQPEKYRCVETGKK